MSTLGTTLAFLTAFGAAGAAWAQEQPKTQHPRHLGPCPASARSFATLSEGAEGGPDYDAGLRDRAGRTLW
ncbi:hypothetical protein CNY89_01650 [Amaricoccus sp. HAR-UPW-R2A-40]|nr:hypothetical protein CNY89_01650 [Amaricoccus sp. HAR-UPW-R2A-40]